MSSKHAGLELLIKKITVIQHFALLFLISITLSVNAQVETEPISWIDLAQVDTVLDFSQKVTYYIDKPPFTSYSSIVDKPYSYLSQKKLASEWEDGLNKRFWFKFNIQNSSEVQISDYKIYLGISDRIFLYRIKDGTAELVGKKGADYRDDINPDFPLYFDFPIALLPGDSISYLAHLSNAYMPESFENIQPLLIKKGYEDILYEPSRIARTLGLVYLSIISIIFIFFIVGIVLYAILRDRIILAFVIICLSFIVYYIRDLDKLLSSIRIWNVPDEFLSRSEPLGRTFITFAFLWFAFSYFKKFKYRREYAYASIVVIIFGILGGLNALFINPVDVLNSQTNTDIIFHNGFMILSTILTGLILGTLWFSSEYNARFFIIGAALYVLFNYGGIIIENSMGQQGIGHLNKYSSLIGVLIFSSAIAYMIMERILQSEKRIVLKTAEVQQLNMINKAKSEFYTNVTHEFRTPLTVILGMAASLKKSTVEKKLIIKNANALLTLVNQLLSYSKSPGNGLSVISRDADIINYVKSIIEPLKYHAEQKFIDIRLSTASREIKMDYDLSAIQKIINNLVYNAIKFSPPHTSITIDLSSDDEQFYCQVSDEGIGIPKDELPFVFDRYYQVDNSSSGTNNLGSGLGLSIVKEMVEKMNGSISVESSFGQGTTMKVSLPLKSNGNNELSASEILPTSEFPKKSSTKEDERDHILIVEDNEDVLLYTKRCLEDRYVIIEAHDGAEGIAIALEELPDLIISDVMMPHKNGFELTKKLKKDPRTDHIPIVLLTAKATQSEMIQGLSIGADDYIFKPFDKRELELRIENIISGRKRAAEKNRLVSRNEIKQLPPWLQQFENLITANLDQPINSEWLTDHLHLSRSQIHRKLKSLTGLTPTQYIQQIKLKQAKHLLLSTDRSIEDIGIQLGFGSVSYFSVTFKKAHGATPSQWRQSKHL